MAVTKKQKNGKTVWGFDVYYTTPLGQSMRKQKYSVKWNRKQAQEAELAFLNDVTYNSATITYAKLYDAYLAFKSPTLKASTIKIYNDHHRIRILPVFGDVPVSKINSLMITEWQSQLMKKNYSNAILSGAQLVFNSVLIWGEQHGYIAQNPFKVPVVKRKEPKREKEMYTDEQFTRFLAVIDDPTYRAFFLLLFNTGMRKGEAVALNVGDYDGVGVSINKTWNKDLQQTTPPKTQNSYRYIKLNRETREALDDLIAHYPPERDLPLFGCNARLSITTMERKKTEWMEEAGLPYLNTHGFRHSFVSKLIQKYKCTAEEVAALIGDTPTTVSQTYSHLFPKQLDRIVDFLDEDSHQNSPQKSDSPQKRHQDSSVISVIIDQKMA